MVQYHVGAVEIVPNNVYAQDIVSWSKCKSMIRHGDKIVGEFNNISMIADSADVSIVIIATVKKFLSSFLDVIM